MNSQSSSSSSNSMPHLNTGFDHDLDSFLDLDQTSFTPSSASPAPGKQSASSQRSSFASSQSQQTFSGPSFQYDAYRQQTGLPVGGLANTFAVNQAMGMQYHGNQQGFVMPTETLNIPLSNLDDFDFARGASMDMQDVEFDDDSPSDLPTMFFPSTSKGQFINPDALNVPGDSPTYAAPVQRMYPGMHSQQAAQAKAQQVQKQQEMARQQQQRQVAGQRPLPAQSKTSSQKDPHVEESISRLLSQMRHNSVASTDDSASTPTGGAPGLAARLKKEEDEMDEDERLLASEEGKKLSSKERRQLRNKVSARAFRSRRKEYIGQLEGELAQKVQEADDLKAQNSQLMEENTRLTDLTRMLLSSPAFSGFLNELSANGGTPATSTSAPQPQSQPQIQTRQTRKDVNPHQAARKMQNQQPQVNMALMPDSIDFSVLEQPNSWSSVPSNDFQVFSVVDMPNGPSLDLSVLSGKGSELRTSSEPTKETIRLPELPAWAMVDEAAAVTKSMNVEADTLDTDPFSLYADQLHATSNQTQSLTDAFSKPTRGPNIELEAVPSDAKSEASRLAELQRSCALIDESCARLAYFTSHL